LYILYTTVMAMLKLFILAITVQVVSTVTVYLAGDSTMAAVGGGSGRQDVVIPNLALIVTYQVLITW
jgi:hypothetical protein